MDGIGKFLILFAVPVGFIWALIRTVDRSTVLMGITKLFLGLIFVVIMLRIGDKSLFSLVYGLGSGVIALLGVVELITAKVVMDMRSSEQEN